MNDVFFLLPNVADNAVFATNRQSPHLSRFIYAACIVR